MVETSFVLVASYGDLFPQEWREFALEGYGPQAVVDATVSPYAPGPAGGGTSPSAPGPAGGGTYLEVTLVSGMMPEGPCFTNAKVRNVGPTVVPGFDLKWAITW